MTNLKLTCTALLALTLITSSILGCSRSEVKDAQAQAQTETQAKSAPKSTPKSAAESTPKSAPAAKVIKRGSALPSGEALSLDAIAAASERYAGKPVLVTGKVTKVCKVKGCWMTLKGEKSTARITFKDYAFFVPAEAMGMNGTMYGVVKIKQLSDAEREHLAGDAQVPVSEIPKVEMRIVAEGVELRS